MMSASRGEGGFVKMQVKHPFRLDREEKGSNLGQTYVRSFMKAP